MARETMVRRNALLRVHQRVRDVVQVNHPSFLLAVGRPPRERVVQTVL